MQIAEARRALIVDDNHVILMHAAEILEDAGFGTLTAFTAEEAVRALEKHGQSIVLLFTDVEMPGPMDGFELTRITAERWPSIGILVASGARRPNEGDMPKGAVFVGKPFSAEVIYDRLHQILPDEHKPPPLFERP